MAGSSSSPAAMSAADLLLEQRLCLALYTASRAMTARYRASLNDLGLTYPQFLVMLMLWEEETCSVSGIGQRLSLDSSTLSPLLKRLQALGLVTRTRAASDERLMIIGLTDRGRAMQAESAQVSEDVCAATGMPMPEHQELVETLRELTRSLDAATAEVRSAQG